jgi:hypothetical protein
MAATDIAITIAGFLKWEAPDGDVRLTDGGLVTFSAESYGSEDAIFGTVVSANLPASSFDGSAETGELVLVPNGDAAESLWWRSGLEDTRIRFYNGEVEADGHTVIDPEIEADMLIDTVELRQNGKENHLVLSLMSRANRLFYVNEGNVCSDRFHQTIWPGELGFRNCTDAQQYFAWGTSSPPSGGVGGGGSGGGGGGGFGGPIREAVDRVIN